MTARDGARTRETILAAAEDLFARLGFEGASMQQIGEAAGVARSTPAYFFQSKEALYDAVLTRAVARAVDAMARADADGEDRSPEDSVDSYVSAFVDFLAHDENFVRLVQRESLAERSRLAQFFERPADDAVAALTPAAEQAGVSPERLVLDLVALCWFPFAHERSLLPTLGVDPRDPAFRDEQKRHLADCVRALVRTRQGR